MVRSVARVGPPPTAKEPGDAQLSRPDRLDSLIQILLKFRDERDWLQFHSLKNLMIALSIEASELLELALWKTDDQVLALAHGKQASQLQNECADVMAYLLLIADRAGFDLVEATRRKIELNGLKYPIEKARGSAKKYTEL